MTAKEIYESIDLAQVPDDLAGKLRQIEKGTKGFTIQSDKVDTFMSGVYKKLKEKRPTALKNLKVEEKVTKTEVKKGDTTEVVEDLEYKVKGTKKVTKKTPTPSKPTKKSTFLGEVKKRKKKGEKWEDAKARIKKELDEERAQAKADAEKVVSKTSQALKNLEKMLKDDPKLAGYPRTYGSQSKKIDAAKDAKIKAMPAGKRVSKKGHKNQYGESKGGRVYWENRDNRSDRYAPNFPNKVYLEVGGETDDLGFPFGHTYLVVEVSPSGDKKMIKQTKDYITALTSSAVARAAKSSKDARIVIVDLEEKRVIHEAFEAGGEITITPTQLINNPDALVGTTTMTELFECGGVTAYQEGGEVFVTPYPLTNAGSADYVAGSNTMSNMFEFGGSVPFEEGDDYWVIENGKIVYSVWDDVSEEMHEENPNKKYFRSESDAKKYLAKMSRGGSVPFEEGDDYWVIENGKIVYSVWDDVSEEMHEENPNKKYFRSESDAKKYLAKMSNGGFIVVGDKDGFWSVASTPVSKAEAEELLKLTSFPRGEKGKVVSVDEAMSHKNVIGREYLESGGKLTEGKKRFRQQYGIGKSKYTISYHDGTKKHKDGSDFFDIQIFKNKKDVDAFKKNLLQKGFVEEYENGGTIVAADPSAAMEDLNQTYGYESVYEKGGRLGFEGLAKKVAKRYEGKPVKAKYQKEYGKTYSKEEAMEVGRKVAAKVYGQQQAKMEMGGEITQPYSLINAGSAEYVAGSNTMSNMFAKGGEVGDVYLVETRYKGLPLNESLIGNLVLSEETLDKLEDDFAQDISFTPIQDSKMKPMPYAVAKAHIVIHAKNFKGLSLAKGGSLMGHGLEVGDKIVKDLGSALKVSTKDGNIVYVDLASGYREKDMPLPFAQGGAVGGMTIPEIAKKFDRTTADVFSQLQVGEAHEMEHTSDPKVARKIALDHLAEDLDYYTKLKKLGL